jgi:GAF domain-containing protein/HAMP domain-containing protein
MTSWIPGVIEMTVDNPNPSVEKSDYLRNIKRVLLAIMLLGTLAALFFTFLAWQTNAWQLYVLAIGSGIPVIVTLLSFLLIRQGRILASAWLISMTMLSILTIGPFLYQGLGTILGITAVFLGIFIAGQVLPRQQFERVMLISIGIGTLDILVDVFGPAARLQVPYIINTGMSIFSAITAIVIGYNFFRQFGDYGLRTKLIVGLVTVAILSTGVIGFSFNRIVQSELTAQVGASLNELANSQALIVGNELSKQIELLDTLALNEKIKVALEGINSSYTGSPANIQAEIAQLDQQWRAADAANNNNDPLVHKILSADMGTDLASFQKEYPGNSEIFITDKYGAISASTNRTSDYNQADENWWQTAYNNGKGAIYLGPLEYDQSSQVDVINIAVPITKDETGELIGILRASYRVVTFAGTLAHGRFAETGDTILVLPSGEALESTGARTTLDTNTLTQINSLVPGGYNQFTYRDKLKLGSQAPVVAYGPEKNVINALNWKLVITQDSVEALNPVNIATRNILLISLGTLLVISVLSAMGGQFLANPIIRLTKVAEQVHSGDLNSRARVESQDEIGILAKTFNSTTEQLQTTLMGLEQRVAERTTELEQRSQELTDRTVSLELINVRMQKRAAQFQAISDVSRATASIRKLNELLPRIANVVSEQFSFYHTGIFLLDEASQYAILSAASSEGGQRMLARGHRLKVGAQGIVGYVTNVGEPRISLDTGTDAVFFDNPDLPDTRSEMAIPLKSGEKIIGALDVQSNQSNAFSQEDIEVIQILADQVSAAIDNARQFEQTQKSLNEVETVYRQYLRREWDRLSQSENIMGYRHTVAGTEQLEQLYENIKIDEALASGTIQAGTDLKNNESTLVVPIKLRDEVIGVLNVRAPRKQSWSTDEINMVKSVADRVAISAENARLFDETTNRAERERTVSDITSKIRSTNDPNEMIQIALNELKQALNINVARIIPYTPPQSQEES